MSVPASADDLGARVAQAEHADDGVQRLLTGLAAQSGARRIGWTWWTRGRAEISATWGDWASLGDARLRRCEAALDEAVDQGVALSWPPPSEAFEARWVTLAQQQLVASAHDATTAGTPGTTRPLVFTVPLPGGPTPLGAVCLEWAPGQGPAPEGLRALEAAIVQVAPMLRWQQAAQWPWHRHLRMAVGAWWNRLSDHGSPRRQRLVIGAIALAAVVLVLPLQDGVTGRARIEGAQQRVLVAPSDGFLQAALVHPGDRVKAGQTLADLAQQDLQRERDRWTSQLAQHESGYVGAMARADRADAGLSLARAQEAEAQLALVEDQLQRTRLTAPFDGVVIQGDLSQSIGAPVKQGDALLTVASLARFRVVVEVDETDVAHVRTGQHGTLALSALPWDTLSLRVVRIVPLAQARDGRNVFEVHAEFTEPLPASVRPGLLGRARLDTGRGPWGWNLIRPIVERLRLALWAGWG
ncbi:MAG: HlyD family efflux transporter periplasmic adaptor subunit [Rubrivivax sp.]|nr:MAG: HlyD family efflux transporter periplasmic adaptor subunit [Rubrivivax sp.]